VGFFSLGLVGLGESGVGRGGVVWRMRVGDGDLRGLKVG